MTPQQQAEEAAEKALPVHPRDYELIHGMNWDMFIRQQRFAYRDGYLAAMEKQGEEKRFTAEQVRVAILEHWKAEFGSLRDLEPEGDEQHTSPYFVSGFVMAALNKSK